ncbi:hypothetical protein M5689_020286 [Euphorbia peplus]|nr:hypothetical protein M5689_020286 [Euphorbia peplus]
MLRCNFDAAIYASWGFSILGYVFRDSKGSLMSWHSDLLEGITNPFRPQKTVQKNLSSKQFPGEDECSISSDL